MRVLAIKKTLLTQGVTHHVDEQVHHHTRGHTAHIDVTEHTDKDTILAVDCLVSTDDGATWTYGGGWTLRGGEHTHDDHGNPITYHNVTWSHEPTALQLDRNDHQVGSDPAPHRRIRTMVHVLHRPLSMEGVVVPGAPIVQAFGTTWKPGFMTDHAAYSSKTVQTRIHIRGTANGALDKSQSPVD